MRPSKSSFEMRLSKLRPYAPSQKQESPLSGVSIPLS
jgi:hypothetical protein